MSTDFYHGHQPDFVQPALAQYSVTETLSFFEQLGIMTVEGEDGKLWRKKPVEIWGRGFMAVAGERPANHMLPFARNFCSIDNSRQYCAAHHRYERGSRHDERNF